MDTERLVFRQGDACNLQQQMEGFHVVLAANLIDRLVSPEQFLNEIGNRILPNGFLILFSPYTWMPEFTPKSAWIGGM